ncbi:MAG: glycosyltransferase, partial [Firmicutes bacterium]|nr:glycosyltransferase [Bacillota bacterium]
MASETSISLCMIVKDEEKNLARCLKSVHDYVDEIIVVDTGSGDNTTGIAAGFGAQIIFSPWQMDFALARNESLEYASKG